MALRKQKCVCGKKGDDFHTRIWPGVGKVYLCPGCKYSYDSAANSEPKKPKPVRAMGMHYRRK